MPSCMFDAVVDFIDTLTDDHTTIFPDTGSNSRITSNKNFLLFRRNVTTDAPISHNLQIVVKNTAGFPTTYSRLVGECVSKVLVPVEGTMTADQVRQSLKDNIHPRL
ncbi:hypothetical protein PENSTE_c001G09720 [Penicillium steckii]|uniref:Uncharacterized protein n=1 Tax=Penicillium steckii TaxID=303698 RepID=A0A1V6TY49_9EURO|nr:hypothetical protein PENSTE_c001G09720 [Penicillium steckii]